jgi:adenylosuccinate synthase
MVQIFSTEAGNVTVVGAQWGDEGKGRVVDWLVWRSGPEAPVHPRFW